MLGHEQHHAQAVGAMWVMESSSSIVCNCNTGWPLFRLSAVPQNVECLPAADCVFTTDPVAAAGAAVAVAVAVPVAVAAAAGVAAGAPAGGCCWPAAAAA